MFDQGIASGFRSHVDRTCAVDLGDRNRILGRVVITIHERSVYP
jgi:hypothetical protein